MVSAARLQLEIDGWSDSGELRKLTREVGLIAEADLGRDRRPGGIVRARGLEDALKAQHTRIHLRRQTDRASEELDEVTVAVANLADHRSDVVAQGEFMERLRHGGMESTR